MSRKKRVSAKQLNRIRELARKGKSTNEIQKTLSREGIGLRRKVMLGYVREFRRRPLPVSTYKYVPHKYRKTYRGTHHRTYHGVYGAKSIELIGRHYGRNVVVEKYGTGKELFNFVKEEMASDYWDERPTVKS